MPIFERIAVVGLGLLGGSLALAARERGLVGSAVGATRSAEARRLALESGAVEAVVDLDRVAEGADLVLLATPVHAMADMLRRLAPGLAADAIVTDVGSVKAPLAETLPGLLPPGRLYIGSHPMAGSHERGMDHAVASLFEGRSCIVTQHGEAEAEARVCAFWEGLGMRVVRRTPARHDEEVGWVSHLPHLLAYAFGRSFAGAPEGAADVVGPGFRDFTRIARSDAELWGDILTANAKALEGPLAVVNRAIGELSQLLQAGDADALERWLQKARDGLASTRPPTASHAPPSPAGAERNPSPTGGEPPVSRSRADAAPDGPQRAAGTKETRTGTHE
jgi:prephenate dehydrogenase